MKKHVFVLLKCQKMLLLSCENGIFFGILTHCAPMVPVVLLELVVSPPCWAVLAEGDYWGAHHLVLVPLPLERGVTLLMGALLPDQNSHFDFVGPGVNHKNGLATLSKYGAIPEVSIDGVEPLH